MCLLLQGHLEVLRRVTLDVVLKDLHPLLDAKTYDGSVQASNGFCNFVHFYFTTYTYKHFTLFL